MPKVLFRTAFALLIALAIGSAAGCAAQPASAPMQPGVYADLWPSQGMIPDTDAPSEMRFSNVDGPQPPVVVATPDASTVIRVAGKPATWDAFRRAASESHAIGVVVDADGTIAVLDARAALEPGDVVSARRVK